ncbi:MAG: hypothetical protein PUF82_04235 [Lactobacillus equicursoris]|uniref:hypothetical protein n=1 Tax=Lactobacillus equicursoris TaxID=420645 RepID=UPI00242AF6C1|nr:hypothetical protein [Lactobacillus equicursoris]MDD6385989.1 hypothetical protein [Lactobacillus equicursoris]MDD6407192.1 hypothetical protein [Lactobacillus equicursoris]
MKNKNRIPFSAWSLSGLLIVEYLNFSFSALFFLIKNDPNKVNIDATIKGLLQTKAFPFSIFAFVGIATLLVIYHLAKKGQKERRVRVILGSTRKEQYLAGEAAILLIDLLAFSLALWGMKSLANVTSSAVFQNYFLLSLAHLVFLLVYWPLLCKTIDNK